MPSTLDTIENIAANFKDLLQIMWAVSGFKQTDRQIHGHHKIGLEFYAYHENIYFMWSQ